MKKKSYWLTISSIIILALGLSVSSCSKKTGCPINDKATIKTNRKGKLPSKRGKTNLFPKKMRKN